MIRLTNDQGAAILRIIGGGNPHGHPLQLIEQQIEDQLNHGHKMPDLIELISQVLSSNKSKMILGGSFLTALREVLLKPSEIAHLKALSDTYQCCIKCGTTIRNGEICTVQNQAIFCVS